MATIRSITRIKYKESAETGAQGERGAIARVRQWVASTEYLCGDDGEEFLDYVYYNQQYYRCLTSHTSATAINPYVTAGVLWELQSNFNFIASSVMFVGDEDDGWVMDGGVLYHTSGTVSLASDGSIVASGGNFEVDADGNLTASNATITGEINATSGEIGGFTISGYSLTNTNGDSEAFVYIRNTDATLVAAIGTEVLPSSSGLTAVARFENTESNSTSYNYAAYINVANAYYNCAMQIAHGYIQGFALKPLVVSASRTLTRTGTYSGNIVIVTGSSSITLTLPSLNPEDDGLMIEIRKLSTGTLTLATQTCYYMSGGSSVECTPFIHLDSAYYTTSSPSTTDTSKCWRLVWVRDVSYTSSSVTYRSGWIEM